MHVAVRALPLELVLRRKADLVVAAVVDVVERLAVDEPLEGLDVAGRLADPKHHVQVRPVDEELGEAGILVVAVDLLKVLLELRIRQQIESRRELA